MKRIVISITDWRMWLRGLIGAVVGGAANGVLAMGIKPEQFNFGDGLTDLCKFAVGSAVISAALYLKQSPVPPAHEEDENPSV